ncbi:tetraacyldisaccharide 4'-kinase [Halanaerobaculum tunisiense]
MDLENYLLEVVTGEREGPLTKVILVVLTVLSKVYQIGIWSRAKIYDLGLKNREELSTPVISVGNITVGGTGKTPVVKMLANELTQEDYQTVVLNRGYKGSLEEEAGLVSTRKEVLLSAQEAGDEAYMLASSLPEVPVVVGSQRSKSGKLAQQKFQPDFIILDDGFQHWQLEREYDLVVVDATNPFANGHLLPRGLLRELPSSLQRADALLITKADQISSQELEELKAKLRELNQSAVLLTSKHQATYLRSLAQQQPREIDLAGEKVLAVSGIGNPQSFAQTLSDLGAEVVKELRFADHHSYTKEEIMEIFSVASEEGIERIITTEKDAASINQELVAEINKQQIELEVLGIEIELLDSDQEFAKFLSQVEGLQQ